jgi:protease-4
MKRHVHEVGQPDWLAKLDEPIGDDDDEDDDKKRVTNVSEYVKELRANEGGAGPRIVVIHAQGNIVSGGEVGGLFGDSGLLTDAKYAKWMKAVRDDDDVDAVVVRVDSPGGSALASSLMWRENARTKADGKPLVISMGDYAASGGYMISANADWIVAEPGTLTGSIGVFAGKFDVSGTMQKLGVTQHAFQRGKMADMLEPWHPFTDDQRTRLQRSIQHTYDLFRKRVADGRGITPERVHELGRGHVYSGSAAKKLGLVDRLDGLDGALDHLRGMVKEQRGTERELRVLPHRVTLVDLVLEALGVKRRDRDPVVKARRRARAKAGELALPPVLDAALAKLPLSLVFLQPGQPHALMPWVPE